MTRNPKKQKTSDKLKETLQEDDLSLPIALPKTKNLVSLPHLVLINIVDNLTISDVGRISCVNKFLRDFIKSNYIVYITLSGSSSPSQSSDTSSDTTTSRSVLSLFLTLSMSQLPTDLFAYPPFARLNLRRLKYLKVTGRNHIWNKQYLLSDDYKQTIENLLSRTSYDLHLTKLEFLVDESRRSVDIVKLARHFPNLQEVTLHGIGYFDNGSYHMDKDVAQNIISGILANSRIKSLRLKSFATLHRCIVIESDSLEELHAEFGKHFEVGLLDLPNVHHISLETSVSAGCFYHAQNGELAKIVARGCPNLKTFNTIKLWELSARSESGHWLQELGSFSAQIQSKEAAQCLLCVDRVMLH